MGSFESSISPEKLQEKMDSNNDLVVLDVDLNKYYRANHITGAVNARIYEFSFLDQVRELGVKKDQEIIVYCHEEQCQSARLAVSRLNKAGYRKSCYLVGGLESWKEYGGKLQEKEFFGKQNPKKGRLKLDIDESKLIWIGRSLTSRHEGEVAISQGVLVFERDRLVGGEFTLEMNDIQNTDIEDPDHKRLLEAHLKHEDFLDVANFPEGEVALKEIQFSHDLDEGVAVYSVQVQVLIKGTEQLVLTDLMVRLEDDGNVSLSANLEVDRTSWNIAYGSSKFFKKLGMHLIKDQVGIEVYLKTKQ